MADEDLHALAVQALVQQVQDVALLVEGLEQPPQAVHVRQLGESHQVGLAGDHHVGIRLVRLPLERALRERDGVDHEPVHLLARLLQLRHELRAHVGELAAAELLVQVGGGPAQLVGGVAPVELHDAVLHLAPVHHQDREHPIAGEPDELDLRQCGMRLARHRHDTGQPRQAGKQLRCGGHQRLRVAGAHLEAALELRDLALPGRLETQQRVDEVAVALVGRHAPGRGVRGADESMLLEVGHDVPDRRRGEIEARFARQRARTDGLAVAHVALNQGAQQQLRSVARRLVGRLCQVRHKCLLQKEIGMYPGHGNETSNRAWRVSRQLPGARVARMAGARGAC